MQIQLRILSVLAFIALLPQPQIFAQSGLSLQFDPSQITSQIFQPAFLATHDFGMISVGGDIRYGLNSNVLPVDAILMDDSFIDESDKELIIGSTGDDNRLNLGLYRSLFANFRIAKTVWSLSYQDHTGAYARTNSPTTLGLILYGNTRYAGQTISDEGIKNRILSYREFALGSAWNIGKIQAGVRLKLLMGQNANLINDFQYSMFTAEDGSNISLSGNYDIFRGTDGLGFGADLGFVYPVNKKVTLQAAVRDIGRITWNGTLFDNQVNIDYEGIEISNILNRNLNNASSLFSLDTLQTLFFPDSSQGEFTTNLPGTITLGADYRLDSLNTFHFLLQAGMSEFSLGNPLPLILIGYERQLGKHIALGAHVYGGNLEKYGFGLYGRAGFEIAQKVRIQAFYSLDNGLGLVMPAQANGFAMHGGVTLGWLD